MRTGSLASIDEYLLSPSGVYHVGIPNKGELKIFQYGSMPCCLFLERSAEALRKCMACFVWFFIWNSEWEWLIFQMRMDACIQGNLTYINHLNETAMNEYVDKVDKKSFMCTHHMRGRWWFDWPYHQITWLAQHSRATITLHYDSLRYPLSLHGFCNGARFQNDGPHPAFCHQWTFFVVFLQESWPFCSNVSGCTSKVTVCSVLTRSSSDNWLL